MPKDCEKEEEEVEAKATPTHLNRGTVDKQTYQSYIKCFFNFIQLCNLVQLGKHAKKIFGKSWDFGPRRGGGV